MHRTPMTILVLGIVTVAIFGGGVVWISKQTPIVRLHPLLKEHYKNDAIEVGFRPGNDPRIEVLVPPELGGSVYALGEVGTWALAEYYELAPQSKVRVCRVQELGPDGKGTGPTVDIDRELIDMYERAQRQEAQLYTTAQQAGLKSGSLKILGVVNTGVHVQIHGELATLDEASARPIADRIARQVSQAAFLSRVTVTLNVKDGKQVTVWAGRDRPSVPQDAPR
ncbi:MAG: hypothetical protein R3F62_10650 [Planctomycetota bacterium]